MTFHNNKLHCCGAETAEYGYDDIHSCCHHYGYGNFAPQLCTLASAMDALQNTFIPRGGGWGGGHLRESIKDVDDDKDYWYGTLVEVTYQQRNGFAHDVRLYRE